MSLSCLGARERRHREEGVGGVRLESHTRGITGKGAVSYSSPLSSLCASVISVSLHAPVCFSTHWFLSLLQVVYLCCYVSSPCNRQWKGDRNWPGTLTITKLRAEELCLERFFFSFSPPSWDSTNPRNKLAL